MNSVKNLRKNKLSNIKIFMIILVSVLVSTLWFMGKNFSLIGWTFLSILLVFVSLFFIAYIVEGARSAKNRVMLGLLVLAFLLAMVPLLSLLWSVLSEGITGISPHFLFHSMEGMTGTTDKASIENDTPILGGAYHAILGTILITFMATMLSVPIGLLSAIYLVEYGKGNKISKSITFFVDVMTGIPSIVAGLFAYALFSWIFGPGTQTGFVGSVALSVLMIPVIVRSCEEMLCIVPVELREASYALGVSQWKTIIKIVIPTAISGIASGVTIAIARVVGETAPLLVTAGFATSINFDLFRNWMASLPVFIYTQVLQPTSPQVPEPSFQRAWAAALLLVLFVMFLNLLSRIVAHIFAPKSSK